MKKEDPAFAMVAGDLVMGHWGTQKEEINKTLHAIGCGCVFRAGDRCWCQQGDQRAVCNCLNPRANGGAWR